MYDLQQEFEEVVQKIPNFGISLRIKREIENCIWDAVANLTKGSKVIIRGGGDHTEKLLETIFKKYSKQDFYIEAIVDDGMQGRSIAGFPVISRTQGEKLPYDMVILSSYTFASEMRSDYDGAKIKVWDLYSEIEKLGYHLTAPFYYYQEGYYEIPLYYMDAYKKEQTKENMEMLIDSLLVLKDFKTLFYYIAQYIDKGFDTQDIYKTLKQDLEKMFRNVKQEATCKVDKDIVMFWIDAVPYMWLRNLPFLYSKRNTACFFESAYPTTPYTHPTIHTLLQGALRIEDYEATNGEITETNSEVIRDLQDSGCDFLYIGYWMNKHISNKFRILDESYIGVAGDKISACMIYWKLLCYLLKNEKPMFYIAHTIAETHEPCIALSLGQNRTYSRSESIKLQQYKKAYHYFNGQLEFYSDLLSAGMKKIYMSDHGTHLDLDTWQFTEERVHAVFMMEGKGMPAKTIKKMFSYVNFKYIIKYLLQENDEYLEKAITDYALIEDVDKYNLKGINYLVKKNGTEYGISFRGVVTCTDKYIKLSTGKEFYFQLPNESENLIHDKKFSRRIAVLSAIAGDVFLDIKSIPEFKFSKKLYENT